MKCLADAVIKLCGSKAFESMLYILMQGEFGFKYKDVVFEKWFN